jgi:type I restriction enzyme S subunit
MSDDRDFDMEVVENKVGMQPDNGAVEKEESSSTSRNLDDLPEIERVPDGWELNTIEEVAEDVVGGGTPSKSNEDYWGGEIPWASVKDLDGVAVQDTEDYITEEGAKNSATNLISSGSVVISTRMTVGEAFMNLVDMAINQDLKAIKPDDSRVNTHFLVYALRGKDRYLKSLGRGTTVSGITTADLKRTHLARPPLPEQRKIASVLYAVDQAIQKTEAIIESLRRIRLGLKQDLFTEGFYKYTSYRETHIGKVPAGWEVKKAREVCGDITVGVVSGATDKYVEPSEGAPFVRSQDVNETYIDTSSLKYISHDFNDRKSSSKLRAGDVITVRTGEPGTSCVVPQELEGANCFSLIISRPKKSVNEKYYSYYINSPRALDFIDSWKAGGVQDNFNVGVMKRLPIPWPPEDEQRKIVAVLDQVNDRISEAREENRFLYRLKKGLMQDLLTGGIRTTDKAIEVLDEVKAHG